MARRLVVIALLSSACLPAAAVAQTIAGVVRDPSGGVLPGVTVEAGSPALIEKMRSVLTDDRGQYRIVDLRPGAYTVTFTLTGFKGVRREGIALTADFTASVNAVLEVGALEETVTVSGQSPLVDVQNVNQQTNLSRALLDTIPTNRNVLGFGALTLGAILPPTAQDVGGSKGEISVRLALHGGKATEQKLLQNGMIYNSNLSNGNARTIYINPASAEEITLAMGTGGSAEFVGAGVQVNLIPKDGGNTFSAYFYGTGTGGALQADNKTAELQQRGLVVANGIANIYDFNGAAGGPVRRDRLWFFSAHRRWGNEQRGANLFRNVDPNAWRFVPDRNDPIHSTEHIQSHNLRLTWQATPKHKITGSVDYQSVCICSSITGTLFQNNVAAEASQGFIVPSETLTQFTWTSPATTRLLFEAGASIFLAAFDYRAQPEAAADGISVVEQATGFRYRAAASHVVHTEPPQSNYRFAASYITGTHHFKAGAFLQTGHSEVTTEYNPAAVSYTFMNGVPVSLTEYAAPLYTRENLMPAFALFAQDQWTVKRLTLSYGLRYDYLRSYVPAQQETAGTLIDARRFNQVDCVPCWNDVTPRLGVAYDLFGNAKTAVKASIGRYVLAQTVGLAGSNNPVNTSVNNVTRSWVDGNGNLVPDCDLRNPGTNGECGTMSNVNFGKSNVVTAYDPPILTGWQHRPYDWQVSATIEHALTRSVAIGGGYYRTWYGNFNVTDNLAVTPADFDPYCITAPADPRLPSGGGNQICGLYDVTPAKFGQVNNLVTSPSAFGEQTEIYNGFEVSVNARLPRGAQVAGGINVGNSLSAGAATTSSTRACFVVDSPQQLYQCDQPLPYMTQVKVRGSYPLPLGLQVSGTFQSLPGIPISATYSATTAQIAPSLGRNLAGGTRNASVSLIQPYTLFEDRINQFDVRLSKKFRVGRASVQGMFDLYNVFNASAILTENVNYGPQWLVPQQIMDGRMAKFGVQLSVSDALWDQALPAILTEQGDRL